MGMDFQHVLLMPDGVFRAPCLRPYIILAQDTPCGQQKREARPCALIGGNIFSQNKAPLAAHKPIHMHQRRALWVCVIAGPLHAAFFFKQGVINASKARCCGGDFLHDLRRVHIVPRCPHGIGQGLRHFPISHPCLWRYHFAHAVDAALGIRESAVFLKEG